MRRQARRSMNRSTSAAPDPFCPATVRNIANRARPASARVSSAVTESTVSQTVAVVLGRIL